MFEAFLFMLLSPDGPSKKVKTEGGDSDGDSSNAHSPGGRATHLTFAKGVTTLPGVADVMSGSHARDLARLARRSEGASGFKRKLAGVVADNVTLFKASLAELKKMNNQMQRAADVEEHKAAMEENTVVMADLRAELRDAEEDGDDAAVAHIRQQVKKQRTKFKQYIEARPRTDSAQQRVSSPANPPPVTLDNGATPGSASSPLSLSDSAPVVGVSIRGQTKE